MKSERIEKKSTAGGRPRVKLVELIAVYSLY